MHKMESIYDPMARFIYDQFHEGFQPIVTIRDPAERLWSGYYFFKYYKRMSFEEYLYNKDIRKQPLGFHRPLQSSDWRPALEHFEDLNPIVVHFDDLKQLPQFPHMKATKNPDYVRLPDYYRYYVYDELRSMFSKADIDGFTLGKGLKVTA